MPALPGAGSVVDWKVAPVPPTTSRVFTMSLPSAEEGCRTQTDCPGDNWPTAVVKMPPQPIEYSPPVTEMRVGWSYPAGVTVSDCTSVEVATPDCGVNAKGAGAGSPMAMRRRRAFGWYGGKGFDGSKAGGGGPASPTSRSPEGWKR